MAPKKKADKTEAAAAVKADAEMTDAKADAGVADKAEAKVEDKAEAKVVDKAEAKVEDKAEAKVEAKAEPKAEDKAEAKAEDKAAEKADDKAKAKEEDKADAKEADNAETDVADKPEGDGEKTDKGKKKEKEIVKELEQDAPEDSRPRLQADAVVMSDADCTMDVNVSNQGTVVSSIPADGFQYLTSGVRATYGAKAGRYYFEVRILDTNPDGFCRLGFSLAGQSVFLGHISCKGRCYFESAPKWTGGIVGVLLNLDETSEAAFTYSLFHNGSRVGPPKPLADNLKEAVTGGHALFPTVSFNNMTIACNFGQTGGCLRALPFKVRMFADMAKADAVQNKAALPKDGKYEVVVPVGLPEEGLFDFADQFLEANPGYFELSDRALRRWCTTSGLGNDKNHQSGSRDKPDLQFGKEFPLKSLRTGIQTLARFQKRNFLVLEAKDNLLKESRSQLLSRFSNARFKKKAVVAVGEPTAAHKDWVHQKIKQRHEEKEEQLARARKIREKKEEAKAAKKDKEEKDENADAMDVDNKKDDLAAPDVGPDVWYVPKPKHMPDMSKEQISDAFDSFELPSASEGFDDVTYAWLGESAAGDHVKKWQKDRKALEVVKDLKPSDWFKEKLKKCKESKREYKTKQGEYETAKKEKKKTEPEDFDEKELADCKDVNDVGDGIPLYAKFKFEDWVLLTWRYELHLLAHGFKHDVQDPDRPAVPEDKMSHYYNLYLEHSYHPKALGCADLEAIVELLSDAVKLTGDKDKLLEPVLPEDADIAQFVVLTEEARRDRTRRIEAGDESCILNIPKDGGRPKGGGKDGKKGKGKKRPLQEKDDSGDRKAKFARVEDEERDRSRERPSKGSKGKSKGSKNDRHPKGKDSKSRKGSSKGGKWVRR